MTFLRNSCRHMGDAAPLETMLDCLPRLSEFGSLTGFGCVLCNVMDFLREDFDGEPRNHPKSEPMTSMRKKKYDNPRHRMIRKLRRQRFSDAKLILADQKRKYHSIL